MSEVTSKISMSSLSSPRGPPWLFEVSHAPLYYFLTHQLSFRGNDSRDYQVRFAYRSQQIHYQFTNSVYIYMYEVKWHE